MIASLLIANRGEIACRIIRTARAMGVRTVAVYSDADRGALHVRQADEAVPIGASPAAESYLRGDKIIAAAKESGAEAIHPGYGFLSENADFAQAVMDAGLIWVGPSPESIRAMGLKDAAKALMAAAGVPVTPGYYGDNQDPAFLASEAEAIGYPVLIKAVAGGGGKGMRRVDDPAQFADALLSCQREAKASFGNDVVLIEKWIESPRHIEVQVFGDTHGNLVHLFERDCSLQRRHQKVIEEAPAPGMDEATREAICAAALRAAKAVDYVGAGTVEFIADASDGLSADRIWFMEMNTRLQVEHPVTEEITGVDLVEWQLRVASGEELPLRQEDLHIHGHAIEARLYAEDPAKAFLPSVGTLDLLYFDRARVRVETGFEEEDEVTPFYDPMLAKLVVHRETRGQAVTALAESCAFTGSWPVVNNASLLYRALSHPDFAAGKLDTGFLARHESDLAPLAGPPDDIWLLGAVSLPFPYDTNDTGPFSRLDGFRLNASPRTPIAVEWNDEVRVVDAWQGQVGGGTHDVGDYSIVVHKGQTFAFRLAEPRGSGTASTASGAILAPMPGTIVSVDVAQGDAVTAGQKLLTLEAMKMEHTLTAPFDGVVAELSAVPGAQVQVEALLARIEEESK